MLTLLLGRDWTANRNEILRLVARDVEQEKPGRILMVPELISHDAERRLAAAAGDTASRFAQVLSFTRLTRRICDIVGNAAEECLDNGGRVVAMAAAARQLHSRLKAYAAVETKPEFLADLVDAVDECKRCCITAGDLKAAAARTQGSLAQKLEELSLLLESYDALCARGRRDPRDQMTWALEQLADIDFAREHVFYIDGFPDFTRQHMAVLEHLIRNSPQVTVSLNCDCADSHDLSFEKAGATAREILNFAKLAAVEVHIRTVDERRDPLRTVRQRLFQGNTESCPELRNRLRPMRAASGFQACQAAAAEILRLTEQGARYRDISLVCTDPAAYYPVLRLVFHKCGIPLYLSGTEDILQSGVIATVLHAIEAALGGFERRDVLRYLRSPLSPLEPDDCDLLENYAVIWGISGSRWLGDWQGHPQGLSGQWDPASTQALRQINEARSRAVEPLLRLREGFREARNLREQVLALYGFLEHTDVARRLGQLAQRMDDAGDNRSAQILNQLWEILLSALEQLHDVLGETVWEDDTFARLLKLLLSQYDVGTIPPVLDSVTVGSVSAMRCQQQKHLLVLGADEGSLPGYGGSKGLLSDQERVELRRIGVPLTGGSVDGLQAEFAEIYGVFCGAEESITVIACAQPSFVYRRLAALAGGESPVERQPVAALRNRDAAGAYLAGWGAAETARELGVYEAYRDTLCRGEYRLGSVTRESVQALYGRTLRLSASQVDRQAECRLSYFLKYGLRAQERKEAAVDPAEFGIYVHAVLERTARDVMARGGFHSVDLETTLAIAMEHSADYADAHFSQLDSQRLEYLFRRNALELEMVVKELWRELNAAQYAPAQFELRFGDGGRMPAISIETGAMPAQLSGFVDRVDVWQRGESRYFRVVDYKTGKKEFDYCDVFNGVGLQMLLYLFALEDAGGILGGNRVSAGVQYFPARAPFVSVEGAMTEEEALQERKKLWKRSGLLLCDEASLNAMDPSEGLDSLCCSRKRDGTLTGDLADRHQMGLLKAYLMRVLGTMVDDIASGNVAPNPYTRGTSHDACTFCPYGAICRKETVDGRRNYKTMTAQRFWEEVGKEETPHG